MAEEFARVGDVDICYEVLPGAPGARAVLLVMGLGLQLVWWRDEFCKALQDKGFRVVRFDNRDVGRSTRIPGRGITAWEFLRRRAAPPYTIEDMADDAAALLEHVAPRGAHVVGASLGAMIAQQVAIRHRDQTLSLTSIMGRPGDGRSGKTSPRMTLQFLRPPGHDPVERMVKTFRSIGSTGRTAADDDDVRTAMRRSLARSTDDYGANRQLAAIIAEHDRTAGLRALRIPALVVHGTRDGIIKSSGGKATAAAIPGAELVLIEGMGHDLPRRVWPQLVERIVALDDAVTAREDARPPGH